MTRPAVHLWAPLGRWLAAACSQPAAEGSVDRDVAAIRGAHAALDDAARRGDYAGWAGHFTQDAVLMPPGRPTIQSEREMRHLFEARPESLEGGSEILEVEIREDVAFVRGRYRLRGIGPRGPIEDAGKMIEVWLRQPDGGWLWVIDNPDFMPKGS